MSDNKDSKGYEYKGPSDKAFALEESDKSSSNAAIVGAGIGAAAGALANNQVNKMLVKLDFKPRGRFGTAAIAAAVVAVVAASIGSVIGRRRGFKKATEAHDQFNEITAENRELKGKLSVMESVIQAKPEKSFVADLENKRSQQTAKSAAI